MNSLIIYLFYGLGMGQWLTRLTSLSMGFFTSLLVLPIILLIGNLIFALPLYPLSFALFIMAFLGLISLIYQKYQHLNLQFLQSISFQLGILIILVTSIYIKKNNLQIDYVPYRWDELSYWVTMGKMITLKGQIISDEFPLAKTFWTYPPGFPLFLSFPQILINQGFHEASLFWAPTALGIGMIAVIETHLNDLKIKKSLQYLILAIFILVNLGGHLFPANLLIEPPLKFAWLISLLLLMNLYDKPSLHLAFLLGLTLASGMFLKNVMLVVFICVFFYLIHLFILQKISIKKKVLIAILSLSPTLIVYFIWKKSTAHLTPPFAFSFNQENFFEILKSNQANIIWDKMLIYSFSYLFSVKKIMFTFLSLFTLGYLFFTKRRRLFLVSIVLMNVLYYLSLYWLYLTSFGVKESLDIASFDRYLNVLVKINEGLFFLLFIEMIQSSRFQFKIPLKIPLKLPKFFKAFSIYLTALFFLIVISYKTTDQLFQVTSIIDKHVSDNYKQVREYIFRNYDEKTIPTLQVIDQNGNGLYQLEGDYWSIDYLNDRFIFAYHLQKDFAFSTISRQYHEQVSSSELVEKLNRADIILPFELDEFTIDALKKFNYVADFEFDMEKQNLENFFLVKIKGEEKKYKLIPKFSLKKDRDLHKKRT